VYDYTVPEIDSWPLSFLLPTAAAISGLQR
jgi:hypothetical protein